MSPDDRAATGSSPVQAMRTLRVEHEQFQDALAALAGELMVLWRAGQVPYTLERFTLAQAQAHHAASLAALGRLLTAAQAHRRGD